MYEWHHPDSEDGDVPELASIPDLPLTWFGTDEDSGSYLQFWNEPEDFVSPLTQEGVTPCTFEVDGESIRGVAVIRKVTESVDSGVYELYFIPEDES